ncbi:HAD family hydrolase [Mesoterricola silvestris]|uniref:phosphoglycolate phosphatase n=1 Tax=Mesoterricola silvestris TaxID=2927979 RepID=A0AA48GK90_9BACT|nr:HAD-IA family hydrolase [Mesoterricola silvestris]BDU72744.1 phosphoglycolate phosphatase [Mesoterricola silvestris]
MPSAFLFDLDGTLVDSRADLATGVNLTRVDLGLPPLDPAQVAGFVGDGVRKLLTRSLPECPGRLEEALELNRGHYGRHLLDATRLYPGAGAALEAVRAKGFRLAVVTNKPREFTLPILEGLGILDLFTAVVAGGDCPSLKPDPEPLLLALERCACGPEGSWIAGDHHTDLEAGRRAGLKRCLCRYGFGTPGAEAWDLAVADPGELASFASAL